MNCNICNKSILIGQYLIDQWGNKAHLYHNSIETKQCSSCGRLVNLIESEISRNVLLCDTCKSNMIEVSEIQEIRNKICSILKQYNIDITNQYITITLVNSFEKNNTGHEIQKGITFTNRVTNVFGSKTKHEIKILKWLPNDEFLGVLAHELGHTWLNDRAIKLPSDEIEGICNLFSYFVYENENTEVNHFHIKQLKENPSPIYGDGFRFIYSLYTQHGWDYLRNQIIQSRNIDRLKNLQDEFDIVDDYSFEIKEECVFDVEIEIDSVDYKDIEIEKDEVNYENITFTVKN